MLRQSLLAGTALALLCAGPAASRAAPQPQLLPTGDAITPTAAPGSTFEGLNPHLAAPYQNYLADRAVTSVTSPDGKTLLVLTSGYNLLEDSTGANIPAASNEYVFVFNITSGKAVQQQALPVADTYAGIGFSPDGSQFYVGGGVDDNVHVYARAGGAWAESGTPIALGHTAGNGLAPSLSPRSTSGLAPTADGRRLVVANYENDSISVIDVATRTKIAELDLRPGKTDPAKHGVAGGEFPLWVSIAGNTTAYISSQRDREVVVVDITGATPSVVTRIPIAGTPNRMALNRTATRLYVVADNTDLVSVVDTAQAKVVNTISTTAPSGLISGPRLVGSVANSVTLSPDNQVLYVTNGGTNSVAVIPLDGPHPSVAGLIPTGWYPDSLSTSADGRTLYVVNGKSPTGADPLNCTSTAGDTTPNTSGCPAANQNGSGNQYNLQTTKAGLLTLPTPRTYAELTSLTRQVATNDHFGYRSTGAEARLMSSLHDRIHHVIFIIKENRTYDQILGDLPVGNGDPALAQFGRAITPNFHALANNFVDLDNFYDSAEVSGDGWQWSVSGRASDVAEKNIPVNYSGRGQNYDTEGLDRDVNVGLPTVAARQAADPITPSDPDLLPGTNNEAELDSSFGKVDQGYIWNAALQAGLSVRNYGFYMDLVPYNLPVATGGIPAIEHPFQSKLKVARPTNVILQPRTDNYFYGFDNRVPDFFRYQEWAREFDGYTRTGDLPGLELVRLMHDHMGSFATAIDGVNTPETQQADNDYAVGLLVDKVAHSPYARDTLIFVVEDDSQDGADHVDGHRSTAYIAGPYVKKGRVVTTRYTTVNMIRTIEDILGTEHLNINDGSAAPMSDLFDLSSSIWSYTASPSAILYSTKLPLPPMQPQPFGKQASLRPAHDAVWWAAKTAGFDFSKEDNLDTAKFNRVIWEGTMGGKPYPTLRSGPGPRTVHD